MFHMSSQVSWNHARCEPTLAAAPSSYSVSSINTASRGGLMLFTRILNGWFLLEWSNWSRYWLYCQPEAQDIWLPSSEPDGFAQSIDRYSTVVSPVPPLQYLNVGVIHTVGLHHSKSILRIFDLYYIYSHGPQLSDQAGPEHQNITKLVYSQMFHKIWPLCLLDSCHKILLCITLMCHCLKILGCCHP